VRLNAQIIAKSEKPILAGLYLSKFDSRGLKKLGFDSFTEAFNVLGYAVGSPPGSIKNYRDEFDPLFSNSRKGWHRRPRRENCLKVFEEYKDLDFELFADLIKSFAGHNEGGWSEAQPEEDQGEEDSHFAKRLITGLAAEQYFEKIHHTLPEFERCVVENTTRLGCGYDFRLQAEAADDFLAVEVKGLKGRIGSLSLTPKEYAVAGNLGERFFLFVVKNFQESPYHEIFQNPLSAGLQFRRSTRTIVQISWLANV
jgi:hypothetical protein